MSSVHATLENMQEATETPRASILVVDDQETNRLLAKNALEDEGHRVVFASGGEEAIATFETERPDCVLLDVRMPGMDGFTACKRIRALPQGAETPILFLTALRDVDTFDRALGAGGDDFLTKPIRPTELVLRVQAALKLRRVSVELREYYELFRQQRDDLLRIQLQKERVMAFVVHDLKNPVSTMDMHAQVLLREPGMPEAAHESAVHIQTAARQLTRMILNLLDVSKADEGRLSPERSNIDLRALVIDILAELEVNAHARKVALESTLEAVHLDADQDLLRRVLTNLVENAIRYAPSKTTVRVSAARIDRGTEVRVADAGVGVPPALRQSVFEPFVQLDGVRGGEVRGGRGLGLTFCKLVMDAHGGRIWIEDGAPGAVFCVSLPDA